MVLKRKVFKTLVVLDRLPKRRTTDMRFQGIKNSNNTITTIIYTHTMVYRDTQLFEVHNLQSDTSCQTHK